MTNDLGRRHGATQTVRSAAAPRAAFLFRFGAAPDAGALLRSLRYLGAAPARQDVPVPIVSRDGRAAAVVPLPLRGSALHPRFSGGCLLPAPLAASGAAGTVYRCWHELAGGAARGRRRLGNVRLRPLSRPGGTRRLGGGDGI